MGTGLPRGICGSEAGMGPWGPMAPSPGFGLPSFSARKTKIRWLVTTWNLLSLLARTISMTDSGITPLG